MKSWKLIVSPGAPFLLCGPEGAGRKQGSDVSHLPAHPAPRGAWWELRQLGASCSTQLVPRWTQMNISSVNYTKAMQNSTGLDSMVFFSSERILFPSVLTAV